MPFYGVLPERRALFQPTPHKAIGVSDAQAWRLNPDSRHLYNKLDLAQQQGLKAAPCGVDPRDLGCALSDRLFIKPIINLFGLSMQARSLPLSELIANPLDCSPGHFWSEHLQGTQTSTDCLVLKGKVLWFAHTRASQVKNAHRPLYWEVGIPMPELEPKLTQFLSFNLKTYTGLCNIEMIGEHIIEAHLRGSNGFLECYGPHFVPAWVELVDHQRWRGLPAIPGGVIYSVFGSASIPPEQVAEIAQHYRVDVRLDEHTADRIAIIRAASLNAAEAAAASLRSIS